MTMLAQSLDVEEMAYALQLKGFGKWARQGDIAQKLKSLKNPIFRDYRSGWQESPQEYVVDISDEYGMFLDGLISELPEKNKNVLIRYYVWGQDLRGIGAAIKESKDTAGRLRAMAITHLYSEMKTTLKYKALDIV